MVWPRPSPVLERKDANRTRKLQAIRQLLAAFPPDQVAFFQDEVSRNHRCFDIGELVQLIMRWLEERHTFRIEGHVYGLPNAA